MAILKDSSIFEPQLLRRTPEGYLTGRIRVTCAGVFRYLGEDGKTIVRVLRPESEVGAPESVITANSKPVTLQHPKDMVNAGNVKKYEVGFTGTQTRAFADIVTKSGGVTSLGEYSGLSAESPERAGEQLLGWCSRFEGRVDVDDEGTVLYCFDALLERNSVSRTPAWPEEKERVWSTNRKSLNRAFILINGVNLVFGSYFVWQHLHFAAGGLPGSLSFLYQVTLSLVAALPAAIPLLYIALGLVPLAFSLLFWLIPLFRYRTLSRFNRTLREKRKEDTLERAIWTAAQGEKALKVHRDADSATRRILARMAALGETESHTDEEGHSLWRFKTLEREARALEKARKPREERERDLSSLIHINH